MDPLLEREADLDALTAAVGAARAGTGSAVFVAGEAGIGKTSLLRALRARAGVPVLVGRCEPLSVPEPLSPLRELAAAAGAGDLPELAGRDRLALARALQRALTATGPAVAAVEDAHWADPATLDVLRLLARRAEEVPLALVVTLRDDELAANPALAALVGDLATDSSVVRIAPRPLSLAAVRTLAAGTGSDAEQLVRLTGGNPFLVVESLAAGDGLAASVRDATVARVGRLGPDARGLVDLAAVVGQRVPPALLGELLPGAEASVEEALARGVLTDDGATLGFRHELTRRAVAGAMPAPRRAALHGRVAEALAGARAPDHARIAHHAEAGGLGAMAAGHAALAALAAERVGALHEASLQLDRALRLGGADLPPAVRVDLLTRFARSANFAGRRLEDARVAAEEAVAVADASGDRRAAGRARAVLSAALWSLDRPEEARRAAAGAVAGLEGAGDPAELAHAHAALVRIESIAFDPEAAIAHGERALAAARDAGLEEARVDTLISLGLAHGHRGEARAAPMLDEARRQALAAGAAIQVIRAHVNAVTVAADARDGARADALVAEGLEHLAHFETAIPVQYLRILHARTLLDRGRYDETLERLGEARADWHGGVVVAEAIGALVQARRGDGGDGGPRSRLETALAALAPLPPGWRHLVLRAALAEVAWLAGDLAAGRRHAQEGLAAPFAGQLARPAGDALLWAARCGASPAPAPGSAPLPEAVRLELAGDWRRAVRAWRAVEAPYEAALATLPGDDGAARDGIATLRRLGADAAARAMARERAVRGRRPLRGPRGSTLANAAGLTRREQEVLAVVATGATNPQVAATLHLSERTVAHHVSAILGKLGAPTRTAAVRAARAAGLLGQDGPPAAPT